MTSVRIVPAPLGGSPLSLFLQSGEAPQTWLPHAPRNAPEWSERARRRRSESDWGTLITALAPAFEATGLAAERLERVRRDGGVVVTTGQQPGLFGGPVYTWSKAMGALAFADELERAIGIPTAAVFWAATDDADFAEASSTVVARVGGVDVLRADLAPAPGTPMSLAPMGDLSALLERLRDAARSVADPRAMDAAERAYGVAASTMGTGYVALLRELLAPLGVPVLDASHEAVRSASAPVLRAALKAAPKITHALAARQAELLSEGYQPQVDDVPGFTLVFGRVGGTKQRISLAEAVDAAGDATVIHTPNVLLRPLVEQTLLPTVAYLGGPGEIAYFAQVSAVADALGMAAPLVLPRWSCTLVEPDVERLLNDLGADVDALADPHALEGAVALAALNAHSTAALQELRLAIDTLPHGVAVDAAQLGLTAAVQGAMQSLQHRVDRLERRLVAGIKRRDHVRLRDVATLRAALHPHGKRQERALNLLPLLARHGLALLNEMKDAAAPHARSLIGLP